MVIQTTVKKNFRTFAEAEAFNEGVLVVTGVLGIDLDKITIGHILPLTPSGYTITLYVRQEE